MFLGIFREICTHLSIKTVNFLNPLLKIKLLNYLIERRDFFKILFGSDYYEHFLGSCQSNIESFQILKENAFVWSLFRTRE